MLAERMGMPYSAANAETGDGVKEAYARPIADMLLGRGSAYAENAKSPTSRRSGAFWLAVRSCKCTLL